MLSVTEITIRLLLAGLLGAVIGYEREVHARPAGLRTHMMVCLGAALAMIVSAYAFFDVLEQNPNIILDPSRIAAQVVSGVGFLGAGAIMFLRREHAVRGLTTAAGLWAVAAIGLAVGSGMYAAAGIATAVAWSILALLGALQRRYFRNSFLSQVHMGFVGKASLVAIEQALARQPVTLHSMLTKRDNDGVDEVTLEFSSTVDHAQLSALADCLREVEGVVSVSMDVVSP